MLDKFPEILTKISPVQDNRSGVQGMISRTVIIARRGLDIGQRVLDIV